MDFCLLKDNVVVGRGSTIDPNFEPPEGFTLGPAGGPDNATWDGERYVAALQQTGLHMLIPGAFSSRECDDIIAMSADLTYVTGRIVKHGVRGVLDPAIRQSQLGFLRKGDSPAADAVVDKVWGLLREFNAQVFHYTTTRMFQLQISRYVAEEGGHFAWHSDTLQEPDGFVRKLSFVLLLTDPSEFDGGAFELQDVGRMDLKKGSVLIFPAPDLHRVTPVTRGVRMSLVTWAQGPGDVR